MLPRELNNVSLNWHVVLSARCNMIIWSTQSEYTTQQIMESRTLTVYLIGTSSICFFLVNISLASCSTLHPTYLSPTNSTPGIDQIQRRCYLLQKIIDVGISPKTYSMWYWPRQPIGLAALLGALEGVKARQTHTKEKNAASLWEPQPTRTSRLLRFYILNLKECILNASTFYNLVQVWQWEQGLFSQMNNWAIATLFIYWLFHRICFLYKIFKLCWKCSKGDQVIHFNMYLCKHIILT